MAGGIIPLETSSAATPLSSNDEVDSGSYDLLPTRIARPWYCRIRVNPRTAPPGFVERSIHVKAERTRARRYPFVTSIELTDIESETQLREQTSDFKPV